MPEHTPSLVLEMLGTPPAYGEFCLTCQQPWPCPDAPTLAEVLDGHTAPIDPHFLETTCPECAVVVPSPEFDGHVVERHGHEPS